MEVENLLIQSEIDILCLQEVEFDSRLDPDLFGIKHFCFKLESNSLKARTGIYINERVEYKRKRLIEGDDSHIIIIDLVKPCAIKRIINIYRSFNPQNDMHESLNSSLALNPSSYPLIHFKPK